MLNAGVNDVEHTEDAVTITDNLIEVISLAKAQFPTVKIVVSEITPRSDDLNAIVEQENTQLRVALNNADNVFLVSH